MSKTPTGKPRIQPRLADRHLVFSSDRPGGSGKTDLWMSQRTSKSAAWKKPVNLGPTVNGAEADWAPVLSSDGLTLFFVSTRPGGLGDNDIWMSTRKSTDAAWGKPVNLGPNVNTPNREELGCVSSDGRVLVLGSYLTGNSGAFVLWKSVRSTPTGPFSKRIPLRTGMSRFAAGGATLSADGRTMFFRSNHRGGQGGWDLWMTRRVPK